MNIRTVHKSLLIVLVISVSLSGCVNTEGKMFIKGKVLDEKSSVLLPGRKIIVQGLPEIVMKPVAVNAGQCFSY